MGPSYRLMTLSAPRRVRIRRRAQDEHGVLVKQRRSERVEEMAMQNGGILSGILIIEDEIVTLVRCGVALTED